MRRLCRAWLALWLVLLVACEPRVSWPWRVVTSRGSRALFVRAALRVSCVARIVARIVGSLLVARMSNFRLSLRGLLALCAWRALVSARALVSPPFLHSTEKIS